MGLDMNNDQSSTDLSARNELMWPELDAGTSAVLRSKKVFCVCMDKLG